MKFVCSVVSEIGQVRTKNEDSFLADIAKNLFIVADGMGGEAEGEVASKMAVEEILSYISENYSIVDFYRMTGSTENRKKLQNMLVAAVLKANSKIYKYSSKYKGNKRVGSTVTLFMGVGNSGFMVHAGDSRFYLIREGEVAKLSTDHNIQSEYLAKYARSADEIDEKYLGMLTKALGITEFIDPESITFDLMAGDRICLCSDGVHKYLDLLPREDMVALFSSDVAFDKEKEENNLRGVADNLRTIAEEFGADDNYTAIMISAFDNEESTLEGSKELQIKLAVMRNSDIFSQLTYPELLKIMEIGRIKTANKYDIITSKNENDDSSELMIIIDGKVSILEKSIIRATLGPGKYLGEISVIEGTKLQSKIFVDEATTIFSITREELHSMMKKEPKIAAKILWEISASLAKRLKDKF